MINTKELKQQWFVDHLAAYMARELDALESDDAEEQEQYYIECIKNAHAIISVDLPASGDEPLVVRIFDNNSNVYDKEHGMVTLNTKRMTTLTRNGKDITVEYEHDIRTGSIMIDLDIHTLRPSNVKETVMIYKIFKSIDREVTKGLEWILCEDC